MSEYAAPIPVMVMVSGAGTNLGALIEAERAGRLGPGRISLVVSDNASAGALARAGAAGIATAVEAPGRGLPRTERREELSGRVLARAREGGIGFIILAGYLSVLTGEILRVYAGRIINLHPSLLPKFGGEGM
ncbi:MAG: phosphoribosylglycinamide formyltransferase, partial [Spirochaetaceae bacterium]|nr:phosphoribosylglycinamide formyltransferase [Spirochaetaceae bacterium]